MKHHNLNPGVTLRDGTKLPAEWADIPQPSQVKPTEESERLFYSNIPLFYDNIERILSDSKLFLTPVDVNNGLAISGRFQQATLGVYVEWWIYDHFALSIGSYPIWKIAASGLSGGHMCQSVNEHGEPMKANLRGRASDTWKSFIATNNLYSKAKQYFKAYTLEEAVNILKHG